jgi:hypothetical protein
MHSDHRLRIVAHLADIGSELNDMPGELSSGDHERLLHLLWLRDSLRRALLSPAVT